MSKETPTIGTDGLPLLILAPLRDPPVNGIPVLAMALTVFYGVLKLREMHVLYDAHIPPKPRK